MPAAFAHDLFGRLVYRKLDPGIRRAVRREKDCFYLGLFGPDILFFYRSLNDNRIVHKGFWLHEEPARVLFFHGIKAWEKEMIRKKRQPSRRTCWALPVISPWTTAFMNT